VREKKAKTGDVDVDALSSSQTRAALTNHKGIDFAEMNKQNSIGCKSIIGGCDGSSSLFF
jgi:hypothetical protein